MGIAHRSSWRTVSADRVIARTHTMISREKGVRCDFAVGEVVE